MLIFFCAPSLVSLVLMAAVLTRETWIGGLRWEYLGPERRSAERIAVGPYWLETLCVLIEAFGWRAVLAVVLGAGVLVLAGVLAVLR
jgi:hypothetical protein